MLLDRTSPNDERDGDRGVRAALGHQGQDLALARGEGVERVPAPGQELADDLGIEGAPPGGDPAQGIQELSDVAGPVLEQVPDASLRVSGGYVSMISLAFTCANSSAVRRPFSCRRPSLV